MSHKEEASRSAIGVAVLDHRWAYRWRAGQVRDAGDDPGGIIVTIIIGIVGAVLGGWLLSLIGIGAGAGSGGWIFSIIAGVVGAVILLAIYRLVANRLA